MNQDNITQRSNERTERMNKRSHDKLVISNVEFCMMQFYKSQWEAQQIQNMKLERALKRAKQEIGYVEQRNSHLASTVIDLQVELDQVQAQYNNLSSGLNFAETQIALLQDQLHNALQQLEKKDTLLDAMQLQRLLEANTESDSDSETESEQEEE